MSLQKIFDNQNTDTFKNDEKSAVSNAGMTASAIKEATKVGRDILEDGGNAADAIVGIQLALSVVEGMNTGIAAGGFIVYYDKETDKTKVINGHSKAPAATEPELFIGDDGEAIPFDERSTAGYSVGVPGVYKAMSLAHEKHGSMPLSRLVDPAIELAESEYRVNSLWERTIELFKDRLGDEAKKIFMPDGTPLREGDHVRQPDLAKTLRIIRDNGLDAVYEGEIADAITETVQKHGGKMTKEDLKNYEANFEEPLWGSYKGFDFAFPGPPSGGGFTVTQMLKLLEPLNIEQYDVHSWQKYHLIAEVLQLALADQKAYVGDPVFINVPLKGLFHSDYLNKRRDLIDVNKRMEGVESGDPYEFDEDFDGEVKTSQPFQENGYETTHFIAVDKWGNIASCTSSIERIFGSGIMVPGYGFMLNNDLTDFNPEPDHDNAPGPDKHPTSSKSPTIAFKDGKPFFAVGSPGAETIVASILQVVIHMLDYNMDLEEAIREPRVYITPDLSREWEDGINEEALKKLEEMGYEFDQSFREVTADTRLGDVQGILVNPENNRMYGTADTPRPGDAEGVDE